MTAAQLATLLAVFEGVLAETPSAMEAYQQLRAMAAAGIDPTAEQWAALDQAADALHARLQQAG
jgi:hypothetical protein